jgi:hypothetical protein
MTSIFGYAVDNRVGERSRGASRIHANRICLDSIREVTTRQNGEPAPPTSFLPPWLHQVHGDLQGPIAWPAEGRNPEDHGSDCTILSVMLEVLDCPFASLGFFTRPEGAEIATSASFRVLLS